MNSDRLVLAIKMKRETDKKVVSILETQIETDNAKADALRLSLEGSLFYQRYSLAITQEFLGGCSQNKTTP